MPHTIHLAAVKLLEAIGAISKPDADKASSRAGNYQETTSIPMERAHDGNAASLESTDLEDELTLILDASSRILPAVDKLRKIIRAIRVSPQRRQAWCKIVAASLREKGGQERLRILMLILDVRTRWSSTHQMLRRALDFSKEIDQFVSIHKDLRGLELDEQDWSAITQVSGWLKVFCSATTEMSRTKEPMLSTIHASFRGLQEHVAEALRKLPDSAPPQLRKGLLESHAKLSEYYGKTDSSPYYVWAALLDPRIMYEGLEDDWEHDSTMLDDLKKGKEKLEQFYACHYAPSLAPPRNRQAEARASRVTGTDCPSPEKVNLTARYKKDRVPVNELEEYFKLSAEDFDTCKPLEWWLGRKCQFPNLYRLACDVLSIPGSAVAVERIFSGGRDTISLRRASLVPKTIRVLMLVKQRLRLARVAAKAN
ncbi:hypothetical protein D9619_011460 [Psilocybe cf. subviscida]|uniref:HAT C-terminal dimerisation domain-containing protein n=1 Tax=Psilocybe cf. subviscida TaxID=2480587 RepID=A0A8H5BSH1_9AGAR|nr:hypothetical protein D9619_011460 [Psilocybe cf. subviscida]